MDDLQRAGVIIRFDEPPECFAADHLYSDSSPVCGACAYRLPCGSHDAAGGLPRKGFVAELARLGVPAKYGIPAVVRVYGVSRNAAKLQYNRALKKFGFS